MSRRVRGVIIEKNILLVYFMFQSMTFFKNLLTILGTLDPFVWAKRLFVKPSLTLICDKNLTAVPSLVWLGYSFLQLLVENNISTNTIWFTNVNFILDILEVLFVYSSTAFKHRHILYLQSPVYFCRLENWSIFDRRKLQSFLLAIASNIYVMW